MTTKAEKDRVKQIQDKCQALLTDMLRDEDNKYCVDCDAKGPRWASWNLGIFLCIRCAGIHRNLGVHISKVKSVNLDTWTPEQVVSLQQMGNSRARAVYEANIPDNFRRPQTDSSLEAFVRAKYEHKKYIAKEWVPQPIPKINWDKELDEEAERQKKRKKDAKTQQQIRKPDGVVPQLLPKPKSSSPKPSLRSSPIISIEANKSPKSGSQDLLGLDTPTSAKSLPGLASSPSNGEDIFSSFLSAPPPAAPAPAPAAPDKAADAGRGRSAEEESFFNQPAPTSQEKRQLTKDSILALYSTAPAQNTQANPSPMFGIPGGVYTQPVQGGFPAQAPAGMPPFGVPNGGGMMGVPAQMQNGPFGQVPQPGSMVPGLASNPFFSMGANPAHSFPQMTQEHVVLQNPSQDLMSDFSALASSQHYSPQAQMPQQMGRMNLGGQTAPGLPQGMMAFQQNPPMGMQMPVNNTIGSFPQPSNPGHTLATNLWQ